MYRDDSLIRTRLFPVDISGLTVFQITESPSSEETEIGSHTFCPDKRDFRTIGARINESSLYTEQMIISSKEFTNICFQNSSTFHAATHETK